MRLLRVAIVFVLWHLACVLEKFKWRLQFVRQWSVEIRSLSLWVRMTDLEWSTGPECVGPLRKYRDQWRRRHTRSMPKAERVRFLASILPVFAATMLLAFALGSKLRRKAT